MKQRIVPSRSVLRAAVLACAFAVAAMALPRAAQAIDIKVVKSPGGVTAWLIEDKTVPLVSLEFAFRGGSVLDPAGKGGLAEMTLNLLSEGAGPYGSAQFQKRLEDNSIAMRFWTTLDSFGGRLRALNVDRDEAFNLLRLALTEPRFDPEPVARVRSQMLSEVEREAEHPHGIAERTWNSAVFSSHPYARDVDGNRKTLPAITADDMRAFVKARFARDNLVVGVVGDITPARLAPLLDRTFGDLPARAAPAEVPDAAIQGQGRVIVVRRNIPQTVVMFGQQGISIHDPDYYAAAVMNHIMGGGGLTSRLADEIREKRGLAYSVYTHLVSYDHAAVLTGWVSTRNAKVKESMELVRAEWTRMATHPVSARELDDAKSYLLGSYFTRLNSTRRIAALLVGIQLDRLGIGYLDRRDKLIRAVTAADVARVAKRLLDAGKLTVVMVGNPDGVTATP